MLDLFTQLLSQAKKLAPFLLSLYVLPLLFLVVLVVASSQLGIDLGEFLRDPAATTNVHPFTGVASNVGVILWTAAATICLIGWVILRHNPDQLKFSKFLLCSGLLTSFLMLDDFFLLHERVFNVYFGIPEKITYLGYFGLILWGGVVFKECILKTEYLILLIAFGFFGLSMFTDAIQYRIEPIIGPWRILFEDGFKLLGIVSWLGYFYRCTFMRIKNNPDAYLNR